MDFEVERVEDGGASLGFIVSYMATIEANWPSSICLRCSTSAAICCSIVCSVVARSSMRFRRHRPAPPHVQFLLARVEFRPAGGKAFEQRLLVRVLPPAEKRHGALGRQQLRHGIGRERAVGRNDQQFAVGATLGRILAAP